MVSTNVLVKYNINTHPQNPREKTNKLRELLWAPPPAPKASEYVLLQLCLRGNDHKNTANVIIDVLTPAPDGQWTCRVPASRCYRHRTWRPFFLPAAKPGTKKLKLTLSKGKSFKPDD